MTATSLVKTLARGRGTTYPDMPWEPKQAFGGADTQTRLLVSSAATHSGRAAEPGAPSPPVRVDYQKES